MYRGLEEGRDVAGDQRKDFRQERRLVKYRGYKWRSWGAKGF